MAPEQCQGKPEEASDQYALAIMAYEWLCGLPPFTGNTVYSLYYQHINTPVPSVCAQRPDFSANVEAVIMRALAKHPAERYPSVKRCVENCQC